jgi:hypothetical protein
MNVTCTHIYFDRILLIIGMCMSIKEVELETCNLIILCPVRFPRSVYCYIGSSERTILDVRILTPIKHLNPNFESLLGYASVWCSRIAES